MNNFLNKKYFLEKQKLQKKYFEDIIEENRKKQKKYFEDIAEENRKKWLEQLQKNKRMSDNIISELNERISKFFNILYELGWPAHRNMNLAEVKKVVDLYNKYGFDSIKNNIENYFIKKYDNDEILRIQCAWEQNQLLEYRIIILKQAIQAHLQGYYYLTIPTILSQIEGIIATAFNHSGQMGYKQLKDYCAKLLLENEAYSLDKSVKNLLYGIIYIKFEHNQPINSVLSRHAILHGADTEYGTQTNSLKTILLFDSLQEKITHI
ncbi:UNVERIFIED_CONTAM: hypothetical protein Cloal_3548 [Acetivibrio alkalicellulosi]